MRQNSPETIHAVIKRPFDFFLNLAVNCRIHSLGLFKTILKLYCLDSPHFSQHDLSHTRSNEHMFIFSFSIFFRKRMWDIIQ